MSEKRGVSLLTLIVRHPVGRLPNSGPLVGPYDTKFQIGNPLDSQLYYVTHYSLIPGIAR